MSPENYHQPLPDYTLKALIATPFSKLNEDCHFQSKLRFNAYNSFLHVYRLIDIRFILCV